MKQRKHRARFLNWAFPKGTDSMTIALLYGGQSGEHEVSLISAAAVARNLDRKHTIELIGISKEGRWYLQDTTELFHITHDRAASLRIRETEDTLVSVTPGGGMASFACNGEPFYVDVVFPVLHGTYGEDGTVQGLLDMAGIPYIGCPTLSSALTMDKEKTKAIWEHAGLPVVPYVCMTRTAFSDEAARDALIAQATDTFGFPLFVKPCAAGSSDGAQKVATRAELAGALEEAFRWDNKVLIEKAIPARELECAVLGNAVTGAARCSTTAVRVFGPGEITPTHEFYDYDAKYTDPNGATLTVPAAIPDDMRAHIRTLAHRAYRAVDAAGLARVDFFLDTADCTLFLNEINALPGFTHISMFPKLCAAEGLSFTALTTVLIEEAIEQYKAKTALTTSR